MDLWIRTRTPFTLAALVAAVSFVACSDDGDPAGPAQDEVTIEMRDNTFSPQQVQLNAGGTVTWVNVGERNHNTTSDEDEWESGTMATGAEFERTFPTAGTFEYECTFHDGMVGTIVVD